MSLIDKIVRKELLTMVPYQSARRLHSSNGNLDNKIWLNANEAPGKGEYQLSSSGINRYPDFQPENLLTSYSRYCGLAEQQVLATRGADEGIELLIRTFCQAYQDNIIICPPTYGMYAISAENHGAGIIKVPLTQQCALDLPALAQQVGQAKLVFLCSPGNPTGNLLAEEDILATIELFKDSALVIVDEAYIEFAAEYSVASWLEKYSNLVVLRTLSKAFALAGLRCGFTLANQAVITMLSKVIAPYPIAAPVAALASEALQSNKVAEMQQNVMQSNKLREQLSAWLSQQSWCTQVFASHANFVLFRCQDQATKALIFDSLNQHEILIRDQSKQLNLTNCLRISIGSEQELNKLKSIITNSISNASC